MSERNSNTSSNTSGPGIAYDHRATDGSTVVVLDGDVDLATTPSIEEHIERILRLSDVNTIVLDLAGVDFMDSTGLRMLWGVRQMAQEASAKLLIREPSPAVMRLLHLTGMHRIFQIEETA